MCLPLTPGRLRQGRLYVRADINFVLCLYYCQNQLDNTVQVYIKITSRKEESKKKS